MTKPYSSHHFIANCFIAGNIKGEWSTRIGFATQTALQSYTVEFEKKAQEETDRYIDLVEKSIKDLIKDEVKSQLPRILPKEVSNFAILVIQGAINKSLENVILARSSSQSKSTYEAATSLIEFVLKKILLDKIQKSKSYQAAQNTKNSIMYWSNLTSSTRTSLIPMEPEFEVADSDMPQNQIGNLGNDDEEPMREVTSKHDSFTKPKQPQNPTDPDWNVCMTLQLGPIQSWLITLARTTDKPSKTFDELMSTPINFFAYIMNDLNITNMMQETLLGPAFKLIKGTRTNFAELGYDFEECYKALSEKLYWDNPEGGDYPFDLTKPLPLFMNRNHQMKHGYGYLRDIEVQRADNKLYIFKEGDFPRLRINDIEDMLILFVQNRLTNLSGDDVPNVNVYQKHGYSKESQRSSTGSPKLPKKDQHYQARNYQTQHQEKRPIHSTYKTLNDSFLLTTKGETEHQSDTKVFTMMMEILLEPTSNKLLKDSILQVGNPVKEILIKLNQPDPRSILMDSKIHIKMEMEVPGSS
nr:hypothetical protein [Tanacetum cinerariifolium]